MDYLCGILNRFKASDFKEIAPEYFEISGLSLENGIKRRKLTMTKKNFSQILMLKVKTANWNVSDTVQTAFDLELEYVIKYSNQFVWTANKFTGNSSQEEISDFSNTIRSTIRNYKKDALVLVKKVNHFFWISITMKDFKKVGIFEKPRYVAISADGRYFFLKDNRSAAVVKYLTSTLGYEKEKKLKLSGRSIQSLLKLLTRREKTDMSKRPVYEGGGVIENRFGLDFTQKNNYYDYFEKCLGDDTDISLQKYTVTSVNCPWLGDDTPCLREMEFKSAITLSGDVARIIRHLPVASIVTPPIPNYLKNFSVTGRNLVSISSPHMENLV